MRTRVIFLSLMAAFLVANQAVAQDYKANLVKPGILTIGTSEGGKSARTGADGKLTGYDIDFMTKFASDLGLKPEFTVVAWSGLLPALMAGRYDIAIASMGRTKKRTETTDFILGPAYGFDDVGFMKKSDNKAITDWKSVCGKNVGVVRGAFSQKLAAARLPDGCMVERQYPSIPEMVLDLKNGRVDAVLSAKSLLKGFAQQSEVPLEVNKEPMRPYSYGPATNKNNPALADKLAEMVKKYIKDGTLDKIHRKHGIELDWSLIERASEPT